MTVTKADANVRICLGRSENLQADEAQYRSHARAYWGTPKMSRFMPRYAWLGQQLTEVYRRFKRLLKFPSEYLDRLYSSRYCKHFYSQAEV